MTIKLNAKTLQSLPVPATGQAFYWDAAMPGFGVRVTPSGNRTFVVQGRVAGKTRRVTLGPSTTLTADEARRRAKAALGAMAGGKDLNAEKAELRAKSITLREALDCYLTGRNLKPATARHVGYVVGHYFAGWLPREVQSLTPAMMVARFDKLTDESGPATANLAARYLRSVLNHARIATAKADGTATLPPNPVGRLSDLRRWHRPVRKQTVLRPGEFAAFFKTLDAMEADPSLSARTFARYAALLVRTGLRRGEATGLRWCDVDLTENTLTIADPKNHRPHVLPITPQIRRLLEAQLAERTGDFVFWQPGPRGSVADPRKSWDRLCSTARVQITAHDLRRAFASLADRLDLSAFALTRLLNHRGAESNVTQGYIVSDVERLREPMSRINLEIDRLAKATEAKEIVSAPLELEETLN